MKKLYLYILVSQFVITTAKADVKLPVNCEAALPKVLSTNLIEKSTAERLANSNDLGQSDTRKTYWIAYSDRDNNTTYVSPGGSAYGKLSFNEPVRIAKVSGKYALVYTEPQKGITYPKISAQAQSRGWVLVKNLLLWKSCPTNEHLIYNKALIVMNLDQRQGSSAKALCYTNPSDLSRGTKLRTKMEFLFVMKEEGNLSLLAKQCKMDGNTDQVLYGWVDKSCYVPWDQRSCLEPNWNPEDAEQFAARGMSAKVYEGKTLDRVRCNMPLGRTNKFAESDPAYRYRLNPSSMRFPILENKSGASNLFHCTAFAGSGEVTVPEDDGKTGDIVEKKSELKTHINLIIVIDGTSSMENFYEPMQKAIQQANNYFDTEHRKVKVGVVIYRDYTDGEYLTEVMPMTSPQDPALAKFLQMGGKYGIKSSPKDHSYAEALYKGMEVALDCKRMGYMPQESNLMFVVGDCGNDLNDTKCQSQQTIINKLKENNIQLAAFQVRNMNEQAFLLFRKQMNEIVLGNMRKQYGILGEGIKSGFKEVANGYQFETNLEEDYYMGSSHYASLNKEMPAGNLFELIKGCYSKFDALVALWEKKIIDTSVILGGNDGTSQMDLNFLKTIFSENEIAAIKRNNSLMACAGYTQKKSEDNRDFWKPVLYISSDEFAALREKLKPVAVAARQGGTDRKPYVNAIKAIIRAQLPDLSEQELNEMSVEDVMRLMGGVVIDITATGGRTLLQIQDEKIVPQAEFDGLVQKFAKKYKKLEQIAQQDYKFKIKRNNVIYYWLPAEDLP